MERYEWTLPLKLFTVVNEKTENFLTVTHADLNMPVIFTDQDLAQRCADAVGDNSRACVLGEPAQTVAWLTIMLSKGYTRIAVDPEQGRVPFHGDIREMIDAIKRRAGF